MALATPHPVDFVSCTRLSTQIRRCYNWRMTNSESLTGLTDEQLLTEVNVLASRERRTTVYLIAALAELDRRRLYLGQGYSSMFTYCTQRLRLSEQAAYARIEAARAARRYPIILEGLAEGSLTLTTVGLLARHLTRDNHQQLLRNARYKSKRQVEHQIAAWHPLPAVPARVTKLPATRPSAAASVSSGQPPVTASACSSTGVAKTPAPMLRSALLRPEVVKPLAPERYKVQLTIDCTTHQKLRQVQDLFRHVTPTGDLAVIFDRALTLLLADLKKRKLAQVTRPRTSRANNRKSRYIAASVRREVSARDSGQCTFVGADGRCIERGFLEFHHVQPFAKDGPTTTSNLQLRCRAHNAYEARLEFGDLFAPP
jgi:hypothetical protein